MSPGHKTSAVGHMQINPSTIETGLSPVGSDAIYHRADFEFRAVCWITHRSMPEYIERAGLKPRPLITAS